MIAWKPCIKCKDRQILDIHGKPTKDLLGFYYTDPTNHKIGLTECECHVAWREEGRREARATKNGVKLVSADPLIQYATSEDLPKIKKLVQYVTKSFPSKRSLDGIEASVYLYSKEILGHADLLRWMAYQLSKAGWAVACIPMRTLANELTPVHMFEDDDVEKASAYHQQMIKIDFLFLESSFLPHEATGVQAHKMAYLDRFLIDRLESRHLPTIFLSSTPISGIVKANYLPTTEEAVRRAIKRSDGEMGLLSGHEIDVENGIFGDSE